MQWWYIKITDDKLEQPILSKYVWQAPRSRGGYLIITDGTIVGARVFARDPLTALTLCNLLIEERYERNVHMEPFSWSNWQDDPMLDLGENGAA